MNAREKVEALEVILEQVNQLTEKTPDELVRRIKNCILAAIDELKGLNRDHVGLIKPTKDRHEE